jgi:hypothetical protein
MRQWSRSCPFLLLYPSVAEHASSPSLPNLRHRCHLPALSTPLTQGATDGYECNKGTMPQEIQPPMASLPLPSFPPALGLPLMLVVFAHRVGAASTFSVSGMKKTDPRDSMLQMSAMMWGITHHCQHTEDSAFLWPLTMADILTPSLLINSQWECNSTPSFSLTCRRLLLDCSWPTPTHPRGLRNPGRLRARLLHSTTTSVHSYAHHTPKPPPDDAPWAISH